MSLSVMNMVWENPPCGGSQLLVLLALADNADQDRRYAWPSVETLARKTNLSTRTVQRTLRELEGAKLVRTIRPGGRSGGEYKATVYEVLPRQNDTHATGDIQGDSGATQASPQPSKEPSIEGARVGARLRISGKPVNAALWEQTYEVLQTFNRLAEKDIGALTGAGQPSEAAKRIYRRVADWPELTLEQHEDIIRRTLASRWWGSGPASIGVVYGPRVFEDNMTREPTEGQQQTTAREQRAARDIEAIQRLVARRKEG